MQTSMKTAFITGATGFLGTNIVKQLVAQGVQVTALHRATSNIEELKELPINWVIGDVTDLESLKSACPVQVDAFFHAAADTSMWRKKNTQQTRINLSGTQNAVETALLAKTSKFIHTSSIAAFGVHESCIDEATPQRGEQSFCNYYRTKHLSEKIVKEAALENGLNAVILNPCHLVGAPDHHNWSQMISLISKGKLPGVPPGFGSFCDIEEVAKAHISAYDRANSGENYILSGVNLSFVDFVAKIGNMVGKRTPQKPIAKWLLSLISQLSALVSNITGKEPDITPEKAMIVSDHLNVTSAKAQQVLGYNANIDLDQTLDNCYKWMQTRGLI